MGIHGVPAIPYDLRETFVPMSPVNPPRIQAMTPEDLLGPLNDVEKANAPKSLDCVGELDARRGRNPSFVGHRKLLPRP